jgi:hypothetical protein
MPFYSHKDKSGPYLKMLVLFFFNFSKVNISEIAQFKFTEVGELLLENKKHSVWKWEGPVSRKYSSRSL